MRLHRHDYITVAMEPYRDMSFGAPGVQRTRVLRRCTRCGKLKVKDIAGKWTLTDIAVGFGELGRGA